MLWRTDMYNGFNRSSIGRIHVLATFLSLACVQCDGANIEWNTFDVYDFSSWEVGLRLVQSGLPYAPGIAFSADGSVNEAGSFNCDEGGSYWVYSFYGDALLIFDDYLNRELAADVCYSSSGITSTGANFNGHEDLASNGHTYLAIIGFNDMQLDSDFNVIHNHVEYFGWIEMDGMSVVSSALSADGPLRVGTGQVLPEPSSDILLLLGLAGLALRRRYTGLRPVAVA